ncbi:ABC transporter substrate-binding protein [Massilia sp. CF038]|uniref:substrate-binding periplasmic protein n=1 Tax=Massilia sp. CF038 TaxID=1881045 RepID=UPI000910437C|nr:transporter substrate-binding domain-containing protein [Massilia sp. CF038]SHG57282.1 polar amino acid transport system substrate-binding protein [Massilia sp. CF038]
MARFKALLSRFAGGHVLVASLALAPLAPAQAADKLTLCFENREVLPWRSLDLHGLNFDLLKRVETSVGLKFRYVPLPWKRCLAKLQANEVDGAFSVSFSPDRLAFGVFPGVGQPDPQQRMHMARYYLMRKKGSNIDWDGTRFDHVDGKIGFQLGYSVGDMLRAQQVPVDESKDSSDSVARKLITGRLAGAAVFDSEAAGMMAGPFAAELEMLPKPLLEKPYFLILSQRLVRANPALAQRIGKAVEEARNSRDYGKLVQQAGAENAR